MEIDVVKQKRGKAEKAENVDLKKVEWAENVENVERSSRDKARKEKIRRIIANNFEKLVDLVGWKEISSVGEFETFGDEDRMETIWIYHKDETATIVAYMCDEVENDVTH